MEIWIWSQPELYTVKVPVDSKASQSAQFRTAVLQTSTETGHSTWSD